MAVGGEIAKTKDAGGYGDQRIIDGSYRQGINGQSNQIRENKCYANEL
jgi:hypothetical protein